MHAVLATITALALVTSSARASDWYVDAVNGNDANSGVSAGAAWKTIAFALATAPAGAQTIHVLPGVYNAANGEVFPLAPKPGFVVIGDAGRELTIVDAGSATGGVFQFATLVAGAPSYGPATRLEGLSLRGSDSGVRVDANSADVSPTLRDLDIAQTSIGLSIRCAPLVGGGSGGTACLVEGVNVHDCGQGIVGTQTGTSVLFSLTVRDSSFVANIGRGVNLHSTSFSQTVEFERCHIDDNGGDGVFSRLFGSFAGLTATFRACSLSRNQKSGWSSELSSSGGGGRTLRFERCTIARNRQVGVNLFDDCFKITDYATIDHCIVAGNAVDVAVQDFACESPTIIRSCIGDGSYVNGLGSFAANPLFRDSGAADFRLRWGSPCIDAATSPLPVGALDLDGNTRDVDGDLNTSEVSDLGAFEFRPLELTGTGQLGSLLQWELWGPQGNSTTLYWTRVALSAAPSSTPFGDLDLDPALAGVFRVTTAGAASPNVIYRSIPNAAALLVGRTFAFQALTDNAAAPSGRAYTNPVEITIVP